MRQTCGKYAANMRQICGKRAALDTCKIRRILYSSVVRRPTCLYACASAQAYTNLFCGMLM